jgi:DNA polymerase (family 10)
VDANSARKAKECGVLLAINTDAHAISQLENMPFGINVARCGWLEKKNVINTYALEVLRETLCF